MMRQDIEFLVIFSVFSALLLCLLTYFVHGLITLEILPIIIKY